MLLPAGMSPPLSLALGGLTMPGDVRQRIALAASLGFRAVHLNLTGDGLRPRELGRSARRDLAALLRRHELGFSGVDLWIPPGHFIDPSHADRALAAAVDAIRFTAEIGSLMSGETPALSLELPGSSVPQSLERTLTEEAGGAGVRIADHTWPPRDRSTGTPADRAPLAVGIDPAAVFLAAASADKEKSGGEAWLGSPARAAAHLGGRLASARLSDIGSAGRVAPGEGRLDILAYLAALSTASYQGSLVLDVRNVLRQEEVCRKVVDDLGGRTNS
ncbi:MAG TPA: TIM barrel protein [Phycisphaerales bacterium]|nr:TIM barrel protein [Phycisphaerales bacterium]